MLYRKTGNSSLSVMLQAVLLSCLASCGGKRLFNSNSSLQAIEPNPAAAEGIHDMAPSHEGQLPRIVQELAYEPDLFKDSEGFAVLALDSESLPVADSSRLFSFKEKPQSPGRAGRYLELTAVDSGLNQNARPGPLFVSRPPLNTRMYWLDSPRRCLSQGSSASLLIVAIANLHHTAPVRTLPLIYLLISLLSPLKTA